MEKTRVGREEIQFVDYQQLSNRLGVTLQPFTLRLDAQQPFGYRRDWAAYNLSAKKHYGYAFQWYAMALLSSFCGGYTVLGLC